MLWSMFNGLLSQLTGGGGESEDEQYADLQRGRTLVSRGVTASESSDSLSSTVETSSTESEQETCGDGGDDSASESEEMVSPVNRNLAQLERQLDRERYLGIVPVRVYQRHRATLLDHYNMMRTYLMRRTPHYLLSKQQLLALPPRFECRALHLGHPAPVVAPDTYMVSRELHYIYSYLVELCLVARDEDHEIKRQRRRWLRRKTRAMRFYPSNTRTTQPYKGSPREFVLYTKKSSALYQFCCRVMEANDYIDYTTPGYVPMEALSYHLVNFMCGPLEMIEEQRFNNTNGSSSTVSVHQVDAFEVTMDEATNWTTVPLYFLDLWNASRVPQSDTHGH